MKKIILTLLIVAAVFAVGFSGCLGNDDSNIPENNSTSENETTDTVDNSESNENNDAPISSGSTLITTFNGSVSTLDPLPSGFRHLATRSVTAHTQGLGIPDAILGYRNMMVFESENENVYFSVYRCTAKTADEYIENMKSAHISKYGSDSIISTVVVNGHSATLLEATVSETPAEGRYILVWSNWSDDIYDDSYLVIVNGKVNYSAIKELADASNY